MARKKADQIAYDSLDRVFATTKQELKSHRFALDISLRTLNRLVGDRGRALALKQELITKVGHEGVDVKDDFILFPTKHRLNTANTIVSNYAPELDTEELLTTRSAARERLLIKRSSESGRRLNRSVTRFFENIGKFTSPDLVTELSFTAQKHRDSIQVKFATPRGTEYKGLTDKATKALVDGFVSQEAAEIQKLGDFKAKAFADTIRSGTARVSKMRKKTTKSRPKPKPNKLEYFSTISSEIDGIPTHLKLLSTLQALDVSKAPYMAPKGSAYNRGYLRSVTGRFAGSVRVLNVTKNNDVLYTYMHFPYDVFLGSAEKTAPYPGRDPRDIIETGIRDIIQQNFTNERIGNLIPV